MRMGPTTSRRALVGAAAVAVVVGVVAGCSGGGAKSGPSATAAPATPTASVSPTASPTPDASVKPVRPAAMDQVSAAGAEAVARYYVAMFPYVFATGDLVEWKAMSHPECQFCAGVVKDAEAMFAAGHHSEGGTFEITAVRARDVTPGYWYAAEVELVQAPSTTVDAGGVVVESFPGVKSVWIDAAIVYQDGKWLIRELTPREAK